MAIRKALLVREVDGVKYKIYPKTSADIVVYGDITVEQALNNFADNLSGFVNSENVNAAIKKSCDDLYNKIMGVTGEDGTTISDAYDTLKEVGEWITEQGDVVSAFNDSIDLINKAIKKLDSIIVDGGEIGDAIIDNDKTIIKDIKFKKGTAKRWKEINPILASGEPGYEYDTGKFKIGDGIHNWKDLKYQGSDDGIEFVNMFNKLPAVGNPNTLYCVADDKLIYYYDTATSRYETFGKSGSFDPSIITKINGGKANG